MSRTLRIAIVDRFPAKNWYTWFLVNEMAKILHNKELIFLYGPKYKQYKCELSNCIYRPLWTSHLYPFQIARQAIKDKVNIMHIQFEFITFGPIYTSIFSIWLYLILRLLHIKIITTIHGPIIPKNFSYVELALLCPTNIKVPLLFKVYLNIMYFFIDKFSSAIIVHAHCFKKWLNEYGIYKCCVIPHGISDKEISNYGTSANDKTKYILFFGVLSPRKGLEYLLQAFAQVLKCTSNVILTIAGKQPPYYKGYKVKLIKMAKKLGIIRNIVFEGYVEDERIDNLFSSADIVVFPYLYSISASGALSLAIGYHKPIIVTDTEFFKEELRNKDAAILVSKKDPEEMAKAIIMLLKDHDRKNMLIKNTKKLINEKSWFKVSQKTVALYRLCLTKYDC